MLHAELLTGELQPEKDQLGGVTGLARIIVTKGTHLSVENTEAYVS